MTNQSHALSEELPYWHFADSPIPHLVLWDGSISTGLEVLPLDVECFDEGRINQLTLGLRTFANSLPEGFTCQFLMKVETGFDETLAQHRSLVSFDSSFLNRLDKNRTDELQSLLDLGHVYHPRLYLFLKTEPAEKPKAFEFTAGKKFADEFAKHYDDRVQVLSQSSEAAASALSSLGFTTSRLTTLKQIAVIYKSLNPSRAGQIDSPKVHQSSTEIDGHSIRNQLAFGDLILDSSDFVLDSRRTRVITLKTLPEMTFAGMMSSFLALPFKYELIFSFAIPEQNKEMRALEQRRRIAHSLAHSTSNRVSDLESESRLSQTTDLIREIIETGQRIFSAELVLILRDDAGPDGQRRLNMKTKEVLSRFRTLSGSEGIQETVGAWKIFKSELPGAPISLVRAKRLKTNNLVDFLPLYGTNSGDDLPVVLTNTRQGTLYSFNPRDPKLTNYNMLVTGSAGAGKSFANGFFLLQQIARGTRAFIIDIGGSYRKMCEALHGQYFEINLSDRYSINPLELRDPTAPPSSERLKSLVSIVEQMVVDDGEKLARFDRVMIEEALTKVFEACRLETPPRSPLMSDVSQFCLASPEESLRRVGKLLFPWIGNSPYGRLLDRPGQLQVDRPVIAFDLKGLSQYPDLQSVMILILTGFILDQVEGNRSVAKRVLIDEAWELLKSPAASNFMEYAARTFRKTGSGITFITQGVEEIVASPIGAAILNNTATKLVMLQRGNTRVLADALKLNSQELRLIQSLEQRKGVYSEGFLMEGDSRQVIRIQPTPLEYWISTSDSRDNHFLQGLCEKLGSLEDALIAAAEQAPSGVAAVGRGMS